MKITRFEELECWREARNLAKKIYDVTRNSGFKRDFRLSAQIQAVGASVMANIAEGFIRRSDKEFTDHLWSDQVPPHQRCEIDERNEIDQIGERRRIDRMTR